MAVRPRHGFSGVNLKKLRWRSKMSIRELIEKTGLSRAYLYALEAELEMRRGPSLDVIQRIANALDVSADSLLVTNASGQKPGRGAVRRGWSGDLPPKIPAALREASLRYAIPNDDVAELVGFRFRSRVPKTAADWHFLWQSILRSLSLPVTDKAD
jgi:transcriptional regulator with XRE-family HTH domain